MSQGHKILAHILGSLHSQRTYEMGVIYSKRPKDLSKVDFMILCQ